MSIQSEIDRISDNVSETLSAIAEKGVAVPTDANSDDMADLVRSISTSNATDYIVEQGTSGIWTYRKWNSGVAECWGRYAPGSMASTAKWGNIYYGTISSINFPSGLFNAAPITNCECENSNGWVIHNAPTATAFPSSYLCTATSITTTPYLSIRAIGKWK